jgi:hypothetical protein
LTCHPSPQAEDLLLPFIGLSSPKLISLDSYFLRGVASFLFVIPEGNLRLLESPKLYLEQTRSKPPPQRQL